jgi:hypothetical protein
MPEENKDRLELAGKVLAYSLSLMEYELGADARESALLVDSQRRTPSDPTQGFC